MPTTLLIVDDHAPFRSEARALMESAGFEVLGEAGDANDALAAVNALRPDVVLLDIHLPDASGIELAGLIVAGPSAPQVVLVSTRDGADYGDRIAACGAAGYVSKAELTAAAVEQLVRRS